MGKGRKEFILGYWRLYNQREGLNTFISGKDHIFICFPGRTFISASPHTDPLAKQLSGPHDLPSLRHGGNEPPHLTSPLRFQPSQLHSVGSCGDGLQWLVLACCTSCPWCTPTLAVTVSPGRSCDRGCSPVPSVLPSLLPAALHPSRCPPFFPPPTCRQEASGPLPAPRLPATPNPSAGKHSLVPWVQAQRFPTKAKYWG